MDKRHEWAFFQGRCTNDQQFEKVPHGTNHQGSAKQNYNDISPTIWLLSKSKKITSLVEYIQ
jgi:hypothetical protein